MPYRGQEVREIGAARLLLQVIQEGDDHCCPSAHGNADVSSPQGRRIIDAVPSHCHYMPLQTKGSLHALGLLMHEIGRAIPKALITRCFSGS